MQKTVSSVLLSVNMMDLVSVPLSWDHHKYGVCRLSAPSESEQQTEMTMDDLRERLREMLMEILMESVWWD